MDHLPLPHSSAYPPFEVPFLGFGYMGGPFLDYDKREGITYADLFQCSALTKPISQIATFIQSWLFFGLIDSILDVSIPTTTFVQPSSCDESGRANLSTAKLPSITFAWIQRVRNLRCETANERADKAEWQAHAYACLEKSHSILHRLVVYSPQLLPSEVYVSLLAVGEYLATASIVAFDTLQPPILDWAPTLVSQDILSARMRAQQWCPSQIASIRATGSVAALYFASHLEGRRDGEHRECNTIKCCEYQVDEKIYSTKHAEESCGGKGCRHVFADQGQMLSILLESDQSIPLICFGENETGTSEVSLLNSTEVDVYVAISHVWSHGMGNNKSNSIWECQLRYLARAVKELYPGLEGPVFFWFDTICFPLQPIEAYNLAMQKMRITYENADKVLVVDASLRTVDESPLSTNECMIRIGSSPWMRRLWTLQEGILAEKLYFQFAKNAFDMDHAYNKYFQQDWDQTMQQEWVNCNPLSIYVSMLVREVRMIVQDSPISWFGAVACGMAYRSTSVSSDEALCLAVLLDLDMNSILSISENQRMQQLWTLIGETGFIHPNALFAGSEKIDTEGFGWAPRSLLKANAPELFVQKAPFDPPILTKEGLVVHCIGFLLSSVRPIESSFFFQAEKGLWYRVTIAGHGVENSMDPLTESRSRSAYSGNSPSMAIMCQDTKTLSQSEMPSVLAILTVIEESRADVILVSFKIKVWIVRANSQEAAGYELADKCMREGKDKVCSKVNQNPHDVLRGQLEWDMDHWYGVTGKETSCEQAWCVL